MNPKLCLGMGILPIPLLFSNCAENHQNSGKEKMNVLFIIADDLNCYLGCYDHYLAKTPNIDRLASEGMLFWNAHCNFPLCGPSRASMMTGLYPDKNGVKTNALLIRDYVPDVTTLSQVFIQNGYDAVRIGKIYHYNNPKDIGTPGHDDPASWTSTINPYGRDKTEEDKIFTLVKNSFGATLSWYASEAKDEELTDGIAANEAIKLLESYAQSKNPFFLGLGFYKPHTPYVAPARYFDLYQRDSIKIPRVPENYLSTLPVPAQKILLSRADQNNLPDSLAISAIQAYLATISFLDAQVGKVIEALDRTGLRENTIIVFTSDHGYHMGEHAYYQKRTLFEHSTRIPLIISYPGQKTKGNITASLAEMADLFPTLCQLAGLAPPQDIQGLSLVKVLENPKHKIRHSAFTQAVNEGYSVVTEKYRYTLWGEGGEGMAELYQLTDDPCEMKNLSGKPEYRKVERKMKKLLNERKRKAAE